MADQKTKPKAYRVIKGQLGPFPKDHVFTEAEFRKLNPLPAPAKPGEEEDFDRETYHQSAIDLHLANGIIAVETELPPMPTPIGVQNNPLRKKKNEEAASS